MSECPSLQLVAEGQEFLVAPTRRFVIGRGTKADLTLASPLVSRRHAIVEFTSAGWTLTDRSHNGTFLDGRRVARLIVVTAITVTLGSPTDGIRVHLSLDATTARPVSTQLGRLSRVHPLPASRMSIGRHPGNDIVLDDLLVSRHHAEMRRASGRWELIDLGSGNGTYLNGRRIEKAIVRQGDVIGIGHAALQLRDDRLLVYLDVGENTFEARDLTVTVSGNKTLLHSVSFHLPPRTVLAVIGPSGAGKSTLLEALVGTRPADAGDVRYGERSLYADYDELRHRIALVPQEDVLHTQLTVEQALGYGARLRFPADTTPDDRDKHSAHIAQVLDTLRIAGQAGTRISELSGGERKRTNVALELLTTPSLLFLDEPTSGLDPGNDRSLMHTLRALAKDDEDNARTVVVVTHNVANLNTCDRLLVLAKGGWVAYFGHPAQALEYFQQPDFADVFPLLETDGENWARRYQQSSLYQQPAPVTPGPPVAAPRAAPRQQPPLTQLAILCQRYLAVIAADRPYAISLAVLPLVLSLLARAVPGSAGLSLSAAAASGDAQPGQLLLVLIIGASLMGAFGSVRELVKERSVYRRERAIGLSIGSYLGSKILVLGVVTGLQVSVFTAVSLLGRNAPDDPLLLPAGHLEILVAVLGAAFASMLIGLAISAFIDNADRGMPLLVGMVMAQLILCGGLFPVHGRPVLEQLAWLAPARWAFSMAATTTGLARFDQAGADPLWKHSGLAWGAEAMILITISLALVTVVAYQLARLDPQRRITNT